LLKIKKPDLLKFIEEIGPVKYATRISYETIVQDIQELKKGLSDTEKKADLVKKSEDKFDVFHRLMPASIKESQQKLEELEKLYQGVDESYKSIAVFYGEDPKTPPEKFYTAITDFINLFEKTHKELKLKRTNYTKKETKAKVEEKKAATTAQQVKTDRKLAKEGVGKAQSDRQARLQSTAAKLTTDLTSEANNTNLKTEETNGKEDVEEGIMDSALSLLTKQGNDNIMAKRRFRRQETLRAKQQDKVIISTNVPKTTTTTTSPSSTSGGGAQKTTTASSSSSSSSSSSIRRH